jgi:hypothetical protein
MLQSPFSLLLSSTASFGVPTKAQDMKFNVLDSQLTNVLQTRGMGPNWRLPLGLQCQPRFAAHTD